METLVQSLERLNHRLMVAPAGPKQRDVAGSIIKVLDALLEGIGDHTEEAADEEFPCRG